MFSVTPSNSVETKKHIETEKYDVIMDNVHTGSDEDENDNDDVEMNGSDDINSGDDNKMDEASHSSIVEGGGQNGNGHKIDTTDAKDGSNSNKSQHQSVTPEDASISDKNKNSYDKQGDDGASSSPTKNNKVNGEIKSKNDNNNSTATVTVSEQVPLLKGFLTYIDNELTKKHSITGTWNFENSKENNPQTFALTRTLEADEDPTELPKDGVFNGSFKVTYITKNSNGKTKQRTLVVPETGVKLAFTKQEGEEDSFNIKGRGKNQYGTFNIYGTATRDPLEQNKTYKVELRKKYIATPDVIIGNPSPTGGKKGKALTSKKRKLETSAADKVEEPLPEPSKSYPSNVVCLRGKLTRDSSVQDGVVHNIKGLWSNGLDLLQADTKRELGFCNEFEYEHRSTVGTDIFPVSGRYTGWFNYFEDGDKIRYTERDVVLKFKKNNAGYYNIEGRGTNMFGKYDISGTLDNEYVITLFRHFAPIKAKKVTPQPTLSVLNDMNNQQTPFPGITLDDVEVPDHTSLDPIVAPADGHYQAVSRGTFKVTEDGVHSCTGKWAQSRQHHTSNATFNFHFGLEEHHAKQSIEDMKSKGLIQEGSNNRLFPVDSAHYKGSFKIKKGAQSVIDQQIVMKFRRNTTGSYNVYGKGKNAYGIFDLTGTLIAHGPMSGSVELFRIYAPSFEVQTVPQSQPKGKSLPLAKNAPSKKSLEKQRPSSLPPALAPAPAPGLIRRESSRQTKIPFHLVDDDPEAQKLLMMEKCFEILKQLQEKDASNGAYFLEPVDPVAHNIPTYHQIITNPMDLGTIQAKMEANEVESPEEFARLVRLVFENAVTFNSSSLNHVNQTARELLYIFNQKFRDVERLLDTHKPSKTEMKEIKKKQKEEKKRGDKDKKRKREEDANPRVRQLSLLQASSVEVQKALNALDAATSAGIVQSPNLVSRNEFNVMANVIRQMQTQMQHMNVIFEELISFDASNSISNQDTSLSPLSSSFGLDSSGTKKQRKTKKAYKAQPKPAPVEIEEPSVEVSMPSPAPVPPMKEEPLTHEEQEELTNEINKMSEDNILIVIDIIKKSKRASDLIDDDQEIELDLDQLDTATQRKLLKFALKVCIAHGYIVLPFTRLPLFSPI